jgi:23S rRNA pseudouridine2605 synthase
MKHQRPSGSSQKKSTTKRRDEPSPSSQTRRRGPDSKMATSKRTNTPKAVAKKTAKRQEAPLQPEEVRLNKAIADAGVASRRHADDLIRNGHVRINGEVVTELGTKVRIDDFVTVNGEPITRNKHLTYVLLNKPKDTIATSSDEKGRRTVFDLVRIHTRLFTVGRLDRNTTGVLLLTNDGDLAHRMTHPRYGVPRLYKAKLDKMLLPQHARAIAGGVELEDGPTQPATVMIDPEDKTVAYLEIKEGRNREVRRIFEAFGYEVMTLDRKQYAFLSTRGLKRGEYRHLSTDEVRELRALVKLI